MTFLLFTSIKPPATGAELCHLHDCLASWRGAGFEPVTVNGPSEIEILRPLGLPVAYAAMAADGKPRIGALVAAVRASGAAFAGIINADCELLDYPDLAGNLHGRLAGRAALGWRLDVSEDAAPKAMPWGYDAFFFDTRFLPTDDLGFSIGDTWWDYWFPLALAAAGAGMETLEPALMTHRVHPYRWSQASWYNGAQRLWPALRTWRAGGAVPLLDNIPARWLGDDKLDHFQIEILALSIPPWFRKYWPQQRICIMPPNMRRTEAMLRLGGVAMMRRAEIGNVRKFGGIAWRMLWRMSKPLHWLRPRTRLRQLNYAIRGRLKLRTRAKALAARWARR